MLWKLLWRINDMASWKEMIEEDMRRYLDLRLEELKLKVVAGLSVGVNGVLSMMLILMLGAIALAAFSFGTVLLLGDLIGSWTAAAFIIGGVFLAVLVVVLFFWRSLFVNAFIKLFIGIFYENE